MTQTICHHPADQGSSSKASSLPKIVILGSPNVGKSVLFNHLTGHYVTVANYPGTTVEVSRGKAKIVGSDFEVMDTPGIYSLNPLSDEERVARNILIEEYPALVLHVADAKNLERHLPLTLQLIEAGLPSLLVLNMMDEARSLGIQIDTEALSRELGIPVVGTVSTTGEGLAALRQAIREVSGRPLSRFSANQIVYDHMPFHSIETALTEIERALNGSYRISKRSVGLFLLKEDPEFQALVREKEPSALEAVEEILKRTTMQYKRPLEFEVALELQRTASRISKKVFFEPGTEKRKGNQAGRLVQAFLSRLTIHPVTGFPILFLVLYLGLYQFVGVFGAGTVVDFLETRIFERYVNPFLVAIFTQFIPWPILRDLFVGEYGMLTLGVRYAVALILPIVTFYFAVFAVIEDVGYLPRIAMLLDRAFKRIGLSGRAVIPMVLGLGCDTMATMVTRTLPTKRERIISTLLLSLAIPCSAQLGVILALLSGHAAGLLIWVGVVTFVFLLVGYLTAQVLPGEKPSFYMELPPLRFPRMGNVFTKTYVRVKWYFKEVLPLFVAASALIWLGQLTGLFQLLIRWLAVPVRLIGLPSEAAGIFLMGFFRRDYGAAGLYDLANKGLLTGVQVVVACVALTLFLPCIAQFLMNAKERGWKVGLGISAFTLFFSFAVAFVVNFILVRLGVFL